MSTSNSAPPRNVASAISNSTLTIIVQRVPANLACWIVVLARPARARPPHIGLGSIAAIALVVGVIVLFMFSIDAAAIAWARGLPLWVNAWAEEITNLGLSVVFLYPFGIVLLIAAALMSPALSRMAQGVLAMLAVRFGFLFVAIGLPSLFATVIKRLIGRARPYVGTHDDPFAFMPFIWKPEYASMPSGHCATAAAAAIAISAVWPRLRPAIWIYVLVIMMTRILVFAHHPSDALGGALVGIVGALLVRRWFAARRLGFDQHDLRPYAWPSRRRLIATVRSAWDGEQWRNP